MDARNPDCRIEQLARGNGGHHRRTGQRHVCFGIAQPPQAATDGEAEYQIYGYDQGLVASAGENDKWSEDTDGGWLMTMQEQRAPRSAMFLWNTDSETTAAQYESLSTTKA